MYISLWLLSLLCLLKFSASKQACLAILVCTKHNCTITIFCIKPYKLAKPPNVTFAVILIPRLNISRLQQLYVNVVRWELKDHSTDIEWTISDRVTRLLGPVMVKVHVFVTRAILARGVMPDNCLSGLWTALLLAYCSRTDKPGAGMRVSTTAFALNNYRTSNTTSM